MQKNPIKIAGAGLAGLTCAINLAKAGYKVEIYEKCSRVGKHYPENPQLLPNWFSEEDVIEELEKCNVKINRLRKIEEAEIYIDHQKVIISGSKIPVGYVVLRGGENSLESYLVKQAEDLGVKLKKGVTVNLQGFSEKKFTPYRARSGAGETFPTVDIIATGIGRPITSGYAQVFKGKFEPTKVKVFLKKRCSPSIGYGYFFPHNGTVATVKISRKIGEEQVNLKQALGNLEEKYFKEDIKKENFLYDFKTERSFGIPKSAEMNGMLVVGEAAGFQDELFRFGMRYAILSGYLAAKSIIEGLNYDILWRKRFLDEFQKTTKVRKIFESLKKEKFRSLPKSLDYIDMERLKRIWLSSKINFFSNLPLFFQKLCFNKFSLKILSGESLERKY